MSGTTFLELTHLLIICIDKASYLYSTAPHTAFLMKFIISPSMIVNLKDLLSAAEKNAVSTASAVRKENS
jgi:hypothetical protein